MTAPSADERSSVTPTATLALCGCAVHRCAAAKRPDHRSVLRGDVERATPFIRNPGLVEGIPAGRGCPNYFQRNNRRCAAGQVGDETQGAVAGFEREACLRGAAAILSPGTRNGGDALRVTELRGAGGDRCWRWRRDAWRIRGGVCVRLPCS